MKKIIVLLFIIEILLLFKSETKEHQIEVTDLKLKPETILFLGNSTLNAAIDRSIINDDTRIIWQPDATTNWVYYEFMNLLKTNNIRKIVYTFRENEITQDGCAAFWQQYERIKKLVSLNDPIFQKYDIKRCLSFPERIIFKHSALYRNRLGLRNNFEDYFKAAFTRTNKNENIRFILNNDCGSFKGIKPEYELKFEDTFLALMLDEAKKRNIKFILAKVPTIDNLTNEDPEDIKYYEDLKKFTISRGGHFFDIPSIKVLSSNMFEDPVHFNSIGASIYSRELRNFLELTK